MIKSNEVQIFSENSIIFLHLIKLAMFQVSLYQNKTLFKTELKKFSSTGKYDKKVK